MLEIEAVTGLWAAPVVRAEVWAEVRAEVRVEEEATLLLEGCMHQPSSEVGSQSRGSA